ncbi:guanylate kinase [Ligaoa zhengdingensis]|uniref:guanylate kinase n=1 Tax=Ligaoa zhengdingensis TaxID=2763658 RepID=UPI0031B9C51F
MTKQGLLVVISGPSGVGKGTVLRSFMAQNENVRLSISATTRSPRPGEEDGVHYYFLSRERFLELAGSGDMLEHAEYSGNYYGTPRDMVQRELDAGNDVILEIDVQGAMQVKAARPDALMVFILPPSMAELTRRLVDRRTEDEVTINRRLAAARGELEQAHRYDYAVVNDNIEDAVEKLAAILRAAKCSTRYLNDFINEVQCL